VEYLNDSVPFELYLALFAGSFIIILSGGVVLRWPLHRRGAGGYLLGGAFGSLIGFVIATAPFIHVTAQHYITRLVLGYYQGQWPPFWWPTWLRWIGPFDGFCYRFSPWLRSWLLFFPSQPSERDPITRCFSDAL
jgi:hypothetical protein